MQMKIVNLITTCFLLLFVSTNLLFSDENFLTLKYNKVNLRQGPSKDYPVKIFYKKKYLPVLIQDISGNWRKIKDHENNTGWIHRTQLSKKKSGLTIDDEVIIFKNPTIFSKPLVILQKGRLCLVSKCKDKWCKIKVEKYSGWIKKNSLWGNL